MPSSEVPASFWISLPPIPCELSTSLLYNFPLPQVLCYSYRKWTETIGDLMPAWFFMYFPGVPSGWQGVKGSVIENNGAWHTSCGMGVVTVGSLSISQVGAWRAGIHVTSRRLFWTLSRSPAPKELQLLSTLSCRRTQDLAVALTSD